METSWKINGEKDLSKLLQQEHSHEDIFIKPDISDLISEEAVLLSRPSQDNDPCELHFNAPNNFKFKGISMLCTGPKLELFVGPDLQYFQTFYGDLITDDNTKDDEIDGNDSDINHPPSYRFDIPIEKSGVTRMTLKILLNGDEICIFGIITIIAPFPNGITTQTAPTINLSNVQEMLNSSSYNISPSAERCKLFLEMYNKKMDLIEPISTSNKASAPAEQTLSIENIIKSHLDGRMHELESKIFNRLEKIEEQLTAKLDRILSELEKQKL